MAKVGNIWVALGVQDNATKQVNKIFGNLKSTMLKFGSLFAVGKGLKTAINEIDSIGDSLDSLNKQFGSSAEALDDWAKQAAQSFGISRSEALQMSLELSGLFKNMNLGTDDTISQMTALQERLADLASFMNTDISSHQTAIQSALSGREPMALKQMGIFLDEATIQAMIAEGAFTDMGIATSQTFKNMDKDMQAFVRMQAFMKQTEHAAGDFASSVGNSWSEQMKKLKAVFANTMAEFGAKIMPTLIKLVDTLSQNLDKVIGGVIFLMATFAGFKLGAFVGQMMKVIALTVALFAGKVASQTGIAALVAVPTALGAIGGIIGGILGAQGLSLGGSSGGSSGGASVKNEISISVNSVTGDSSISKNGYSSNIQTNFGSGM